MSELTLEINFFVFRCSVVNFARRYCNRSHGQKYLAQKYKYAEKTESLNF